MNDRIPSQSDLVEITAKVRGETELGFRLSDGTKSAWVPKAYVHENGDGTFAMPSWLAKEKGFI